MTISNNYIHDNTSNIGIYLSELSGVNTISGNIIQGNSFVAGAQPDGVGILVNYIAQIPDATFNITGNTITNNTGIAVLVLGNTGTPTINLGNNNLYGNSNVEVYNSSPWDITATNNWWNTVSCAAIEAEVYHSIDNPANGTVDFDPALNAAYPGGAAVSCT